VSLIHRLIQYLKHKFLLDIIWWFRFYLSHKNVHKVFTKTILLDFIILERAAHKLVSMYRQP